MRLPRKTARNNFRVWPDFHEPKDVRPFDGGANAIMFRTIFRNPSRLEFAKAIFQIGKFHLHCSGPCAVPFGKLNVSRFRDDSANTSR